MTMKRMASPSVVWRACASWCLRRAALVVAVLHAGAAAAQALISPVIVEFAPRQKIATVRVTVSDRAVKPMRLQAQLLAWQQDLHGAALTQPSEDLIVTPRIAELKPGEQQVLRLALRGSLPADTERAYRLVLEDIGEPSAIDMGSGAAVNFRMAYDLPVMVSPRGTPVTAMRWRACPRETAAPARQGVCVRITNTGNRRVKVQSLTLAGDGWEKSIAFREPDAVLAGAEREWVLPVLAQGPMRGVKVRTASGQLLQAEAAAD
jgi:fimbrial chaperone protein